MTPPLRIDVHQHLWPEQLLMALTRRDRSPSLRYGHDGWWLSCPGEPETRFEPRDHDLARRAGEAQAERLELALITPSLPLGAELLPAGEAEELAAIHNEAAASLPYPFGAWATVALQTADARSVDALLERGHFAGLALPAAALGSREGLNQVGPLLEVLERRSLPLFVHPGAVSPKAAGRGRPSWWNAMNAYLSDLSAAWYAFVAFGRFAHPRLRVLFAAMAGGAPLHLERMVARGGPACAALDHGIYYETSSYGERAVDALVRTVGVDQIVYGSDRPVVDASPWGLGDSAERLVTVDNPARLLGLPVTPSVRAVAA
jgi:predicted TIM-barrel fold metal-dependent hydrolase